ncbi:MAG: hypothetical protein BroJett014_24350 [Planctomycetota bacterium]|jgi:hypothetical protein|nr:MAG: hypothetical protein BroJett014_24350 [Planctomycetota bacterium]
MNIEFVFVVFCLTLIGIIAIVFGKEDIAKIAVSSLAKRFEDVIQAVGEAVKLVTEQQISKNTKPDED